MSAANARPPAVSDLATYKRKDLITLWLALFCKPVPKSLSMTMMRRMIGFELQARTYGGLSASLKRRISGLAKNDSATQLQAQAHLEGTRLVREWNGVTHVVDVHEDGFTWQGREYRSLSAIANAITGTHWSGPRFFGSTKAQSKCDQP